MAEDQARQIVSDAERALREVVAKNAVRGDYPAVVRVTAWAKALRKLLPGEPAESAGAT